MLSLAWPCVRARAAKIEDEGDERSNAGVGDGSDVTCRGNSGPAIIAPHHEG